MRLFHPVSRRVPLWRTRPDPYTATLHDATIVYPPNRKPYVLVVLTRNIPREETARQLIVDVSRLTWNNANGATSTTGAK